MNKILNLRLVFGFLLLSIIYNCSSDTDETEIAPTNSSTNNGNEVVMTENNGDVTEVITMNMEEMETIQNNPSNPTISNTNNKPNDTPVVRVLSEVEMAKLNFATISIFDKNEANRSNARKWVKPVKLFLSGTFGNDEINFINDFSKELASISSEIDLRIVDNLRDSNVEMYIATKQQYAEEGRNFLGDIAPGLSEAGRANILWGIPSYEINGTKIWVDPSERNYDTVIKHEILHILGFGHNNNRNSVMNPTPSSDPTLSENDIFAIKTLYSDLINPSYSENDVRNTVENNVKKFFE